MQLSTMMQLSGSAIVIEQLQTPASWTNLQIAMGGPPTCSSPQVAQPVWLVQDPATAAFGSIAAKVKVVIAP